MSKLQTYTAEALQAAYVEGFCNGHDHGNLPYKYPPLSIAFIESETRKHLDDVKQTPEIQRQMVDAWYAMKFDEREKMGSPPFDDVKAVEISIDSLFEKKSAPSDGIEVECSVCKKRVTLPYGSTKTVVLIHPMEGWEGPPPRCPECAELVAEHGSSILPNRDLNPTH